MKNYAVIRLFIVHNFIEEAKVEIMGCYNTKEKALKAISEYIDNTCNYYEKHKQLWPVTVRRETMVTAHDLNDVTHTSYYYIDEVPKKVC